MYTKHDLEIKVTDHLDNKIEMNYNFDLECNFMTAVSAVSGTQTYLLQALDAYARTKGYSSAKEMPKNFKQTLNLREVLAVVNKG